MKSEEAQQAYRDGLINKREMEDCLREHALFLIRDLVEQVATQEEAALGYAVRLLAEGEFQQAESVAQLAIDRIAIAEEESEPSVEERREHDKWL